VSSPSFNYLATITKVETIWIPATEALTIKVNGGTNNGGYTYQTTLDSAISQSSTYSVYAFAGVEAANNGITVQEIITPVKTIGQGITGATSGAITGIPFIDAILQAGSNILSAVTQFAAFIAVIFGFTQNALVPYWLWAILMTPAALFLYLGLELARGTS
jgi:hypothetical protein